MNEQQFKDFIEKNFWKYSVKYAKTFPHWYCLKERCTDQEDFEKAVVFIRENGFARNFWKQVYIYYELDGYEYWTMGAPVDETILINKAEKKIV